MQKYTQFSNITDNHAAGGAKVVDEGTNTLANQVTLAASDDADIAFFLIGTNDTTIDDTFRAEYEEQVNAFKVANPSATIYLLGVLPRWKLPINRDTVNPLIQTVATNTSTTYVDTDGWIVEADTTDGLHLTAAGKQKVADALWTAIA